MKSNNKFSNLLTLKNYLFFSVINGIPLILFFLYLIDVSLPVIWTLLYTIFIVLTFLIGSVMLFVNRKRPFNLGSVLVLSSVIAFILMMILNVFSSSINSKKHELLIQTKDSEQIVGYIKALDDFKEKNGIYPESLSQLSTVNNELILPRGVSLIYNQSSDDYVLKLSQTEGYFLFDGCGPYESSVVRTSKNLSGKVLHNSQKALNDYWFTDTNYPSCM